MKKILPLLLATALLVTSLSHTSIQAAETDKALLRNQLELPINQNREDSYLTLEQLENSYPISQIQLLSELNKGYSLQELKQALEIQKEQKGSLDTILQRLNPTVVEHLNTLRNQMKDLTQDSVSQVTYKQLEGKYAPLMGESTPLSEYGEALPQWKETVTHEVYGGRSVSDNVYGRMSQSMAMTSSMPSYPTTTDALAIQRLHIKADSAPYAVGGNEAISTVDGSLQLEEVDMSLPGRNGLGFSLKRRYNSNDALYYDKATQWADVYYVDYYPKLQARLFFANGSPTFSWSASDFGFYYNYRYMSIIEYQGTLVGWPYPSNPLRVREFDDQEKRRLEKFWYKVDPDEPNALDHYSDSNIYINGTRFTARAYTTGEVVSVPGSDYYFGERAIKNAKRIKYKEEERFPLGKGWSWDLPFIKYDEPNNAYGKVYITLFGGSTYEIQGSFLTGYKLIGYPWKDLTLERDSSVFVNDDRSDYVLKNIDGSKQYFTYAGRLIQMTDAYNNTIKFTYEEDIPYYGKALTEIADDSGNKIVITYTQTTVTLTQGDRKVTYTKMKDPMGFRDLLAKVEDPMERTTSYVYAMENAPFDIVGGGFPADNPIALLKQVNYPTKSRSEYSYVPFKRSLGESATETVFRVNKRQDVVTYADGQEKVFNPVTYTYQGDGGSFNKSTLSFSTTVNNGRLNTTYAFDKVYTDDNTPEVLYNTQIKQDDGTYQVIQDMEYDRANRRSIPVKITTTNKKGTQTSTPQVITRSYDEYRNLLSETNPDQVTTTYSYDSSTHLLTSTVTPVSERLSQYVELERYPTYNSIKTARVKENNASGKLMAETGYVYDAYGNPVTVTIKDDNRTIKVNTAYGSQYGYRFPTSQTIVVTDASGKASTVSQSYAYNSKTGQMTRFTDGRGYSTDYTYDKLGRMLTMKNPDGSQSSVIYNDQDNTVTSTDPTNVKTLTKWNPLGWKTETSVVGKAAVTYGYDTFGRLEWVADGAANRTTYRYDAWDRLVQTNLPGKGAATSTTAYDPINRLVTTTDPEGYSSKTWNDGMGRVIRAESYSPTNVKMASSKMSYNVAGLVKEQETGLETEAGGVRRTKYAYDVMGRLTAVTNALNETTTYSYSLANQLIRVQYPDGNGLGKAYDEMGRLIRRTDPSGKTDTYFYDAASNLTKKTDRMGQSTTYAYSNRNLLTSVVDAKETISYTWDTAGRRLSMTDQTGKTAYAYETGSGWLTKVTYPDQRTTTYAYDSQGNRTRMTDPFGIVTSYGYDTQNRLDRVGSTAGQWDAVYGYRKNSQLSSLTRPNGINTTWAYDSLKTTLTHSRSGQGAWQSYQNEYDINGNIKKRVENGSSQSFGYDKLDRVQNSSLYSESYTYDNRGNRNTLLSEKPFAWKEQSYAYDQKNRLTQVTNASGGSVSYRYNGDGLLTERTEGGQTTRYYYDGANIIAEGTVTGSNVTHKASYIRGKQLETRVDASRSKSYYVLNGHGDVVGLVDGAGKPLNTYTYDIWGAPITTQETISQPFRYSGEYWDNSTGLQYLRARWYDPSVGRFMGEDTYEGELTNPLSQNLYTYGHNNPIKFIDPSGFKVVTTNYSGTYEVSNGLVSIDVNTNVVLWGERGNVPIRDYRTTYDENGNFLLVGNSYTEIAYTVKQHTFTNLNITVYENMNGSGFSTSSIIAAQNRGNMAFIETGSTTRLSTVSSLSNLDDSHKYDKAWNWTKVTVGGATDVLAIGKAAKLVKSSPTIAQKAWGAFKELFVPGADDAATTGVDYFAMGDDPSIDWLTGLIPIYGTYQTYLDATSKKPLGAFVGN